MHMNKVGTHYSYNSHINRTSRVENTRNAVGNWNLKGSIYKFTTAKLKSLPHQLYIYYIYDLKMGYSCFHPLIVTDM